MATVRKPRGTRGGRVCQIRIQLVDLEREIWRVLRVPGGADLGWLHAVLQISMGWTNSHLHAFRSGKRVISDPFAMDEGGGDASVTDEREVKIEEALARKGSILHYEYDFGDSWNHEIRLEAFADPADHEPAFAVCIDGAGACPPEDCGGPFGYEEMLLALKNPKHPEYDEAKEWLGKSFDPDRFSVEDTNRRLKKLRLGR